MQAAFFLKRSSNKGIHRPLLRTSIGTTAWFLHRAPSGGLSPNRHAKDETPDFPIRQWAIHHLACTRRAATQPFSTRLTPQRLGNKHQPSTNEGRQTKIAPSTCQCDEQSARSTRAHASGIDDRWAEGLEQGFHTIHEENCVESVFCVHTCDIPGFLGVSPCFRLVSGDTCCTSDSIRTCARGTK